MGSYVSLDAQQALDAFTLQAHRYNLNLTFDGFGAIVKSPELVKVVESAEEPFAVILGIATSGA